MVGQVGLPGDENRPVNLLPSGSRVEERMRSSKNRRPEVQSRCRVDHIAINGAGPCPCPTLRSAGSLQVPVQLFQEASLREAMIAPATFSPFPLFYKAGAGARSERGLIFPAFHLVAVWGCCQAVASLNRMSSSAMEISSEVGAPVVIPLPETARGCSTKRRRGSGGAF